MAPRGESRGQKVKTFTEQVMQEDGTYAKQQFAVYLRGEDTMFAIYLPDYIAKTVRGDPKLRRGDRGDVHSDDSIRAVSYDVAYGHFRTAHSRFVEIMQDRHKRKMISFEFKANRYGDHGKHFPLGSRSEISFCPTPALAVTYEVLWAVGDVLFLVDHHEGGIGQRWGSVTNYSTKHGHLIDWTPEREAFFKALDTGLVTLIQKLEAFTATVKAGDPDAAIAQLASSFGLAALPAPALAAVDG